MAELSAVPFSALPSTDDGYTLLNNNGIVHRSSKKLSELVGDKTNSFLTKEEGDTLYQEKGDYLVDDDISGKLDKSQYAVDSATFLTAHQDISNKLDTTAFSTVSGDFLTEHQNLDEYATQDWVNNKGFLTEHQPISANEWNNVYETVVANSGTWGTESDWEPDIISASNNAYNSAVEWVKNQNYLTEHQNISNKLDTSSFSEVSGSFLTAINIPESATWNEVSTTVQSNSAQWGQGGQGGGNMLTSYLEYNDQNQISGYNGSAFAGETLTGDAQGAVDTVYSTSGNIITGTKSDYDFTARNVTNVTFGNFTINGIRSYIKYDRPGYPTDSWLISKHGFYLGPEFAADYWENYARVWLERTGLSSMSGTKSDKKLIWRALLDNDVEGANNTITAIAGSALVGVGLTGEFVPQSAFDELKQSYDALYSLFATYSGQWLLPNEGV